MDEVQPAPDKVPAATVDRFIHNETVQYFPSWQEDRCNAIINRRDYREIHNYHQAVEFLLLYFDKICKKHYYQQFEAETIVSVFAVPYKEPAKTALSSAEFDIARRLFTLFKRIITKTTQEFSHVINPAFKKQLDVLGNILVTVTPVEAKMHQQPSTSTTKTQRPAIQPPTKQTDKPTSHLLKRAIKAHLPEDDTTDEFNLETALDNLRLEEVPSPKENLHSSIYPPLYRQSPFLYNFYHVCCRVFLPPFLQYPVIPGKFRHFLRMS